VHTPPNRRVQLASFCNPAVTTCFKAHRLRAWAASRVCQTGIKVYIGHVAAEAAGLGAGAHLLSEGPLLGVGGWRRLRIRSTSSWAHSILYSSSFGLLHPSLPPAACGAGILSLTASI
jgi:hypothetical protein